ncbi:hypothetical protein KC332_g13628 [Hortaea werneckii]|nr:hypothetical protein KC358_g13860 [Hortaea werneckii]KAI6831213.1 hypothetical protein KC350_g7401 [Hortaea werneckii]KAI6906561.1 hypothetical protein KC348_g14595 [Hortaea werneckii]KAI6961568.1 hypothetical protein KC321_g12245 [Hortaea werneckii]KAI7017300.1 hypothetical protein KC362_g14722 [Hortaea werneckii]
MAGRTPSQEPPLKRVRKGTKSCTECRHRKIRCDWSSEHVATCDQCLARDRSCVLQVHELKTADAIQSTPRARILQLERQVQYLSGAVRRLNDKFGIEENAHDALALHATPSTDLRGRDSIDEHNEVPNDTEDTSEGPTSPPPHLMQLFSNSVLGADGHSNENDSPSSARHSTGKSHTLSLLRKHLPSRDDLVKIASLASRWLAIYDSMFPMIKTPKTSEEMVSSFDRLWQEHSPAAADSDWNPALSCASLLLAIAITAQQTSVDRKEPELQSIGNATHFVKQISDMVERLVIADDALIESLAGIEVALLWLRLQLGRAKIKKMYIVIRRIVAFAELSGLPGAPEAMESRRSGAVTGTSDRDLWHKAELWESICAVDRIIVLTRSYVYRLAEIASRILDLDRMSSSGKPGYEIFNTVMSIDQELRYLANQFAFNFATCTEASQALARRYAALRPLLPIGFFASRVIDLQAFTGAVFLLLASQRNVLTGSRRLRSSDNFSEAEANRGLAQGIVDGMETSAADATGMAADFGRQAAGAIRSLSDLLLLPPSNGGCQRVTLRLPLIGNIHVARKPASDAASQSGNKAPPVCAQQYPHSGDQRGSSNDLVSGPRTDAAQGFLMGDPQLDMLSYSMEIPDNFYPTLNGDVLNSEQWFTWN